MRTLLLCASVLASFAALAVAAPAAKKPTDALLERPLADVDQVKHGRFGAQGPRAGAPLAGYLHYRQCPDGARSRTPPVRVT